MGTFKRYLVVLLIAFFSVAASGTVAMAHCDSSVQGRDNVGIEKKMDGCSHSHSHSADEEKHGHSKNADENAHGCCSTVSSDPTSSGEPASSGNEAQTASCIDCNTGLCHTQNVVTIKTSAVFYATLSDFLTSKDINLATVFLNIIPDPPNSVS